MFSLFVLPALFLLSLGLGVGSLVSRVDGVTYAAWVAPGLITMTAFQLAISESTMGVYTDFTWIGAFHVMRQTRVRIPDMIAGWHLYVLVVLELSVVAFLAVAWILGVRQPGLVVASPFVNALLALSVAAPTTAFAATVRDDSRFHLLTQFGVVPATAISGIFFPVDRLPRLVRPLADLSPLWHATELNRAAALGTATAWPVAAHVGYLLAWTIAGFGWAYVAFRRRLSE